MDINKRRILIKSYIFLQFSYCLLAWMCPNWSLNNKKKLTTGKNTELKWIVHRNYKSNFKELLLVISSKMMNEIFDSVKILSIVSGVVPNLTNLEFKLFICEVNRQLI